jgi:hypothetical protein
VRGVRLGACLLAALPLGAAGRATAADDALSIGLRWAKGQTLTYRLTERDKTLSALDATGLAALPSEVRITTMTLEVKDVAADGTARVELIVRSVRVENEAFGGRTVYDTAEASGPRPDDPLHSFSVAQAMVGRPLTVVFAPDGRPREVEGMQPILKTLVARLRDPGVGFAGAGEIAKSLDGEIFRAQLESAFQLLSSPPVAVGESWTGSIKWSDPRSGEVRVLRRFVLESVAAAPDGPVAHVRTVVEAHRDAEGNIPRDFSDEDLEWAVDTLAGTGEVLFDTLLGQPRSTALTTRVAFVNRVGPPTGGLPDYERVVAELESSASLELLEASGPRPPLPSPVARAAPRAEALATFADFTREAEEACFVSTRDQTNIEIKGAAAATETCLRRRMVAELDRVLVPLQAKDRARFDALMKEQAAWNRYVDDVCWLAEEAQWVALEEATRSDGTARTYALIACLHHAALERGYFVRALRLGDARGAAVRLRARDAEGGKARAYLAKVREAMARPASPPAEISLVAHALSPAERLELSRRTEAIGAGAGELARITCARWPELARAVGGGAACAAAAERHYLAYGPSEDRGP